MVGRVAQSWTGLATATALTVSFAAPLGFAQERPASSALQQLTAWRNVATRLSSTCKVKSPAFEGRAALRTVRRALREGRPLRVLAIGSSSTVGVGASSAVASYPVRLENDLEGFLQGFNVEMISRGISGEIAGEAAERMKLEVAEAHPDLVVWQVGTNDAMARVEEDHFSDLLRDTLKWLAKNSVDVVLIDPQYVERMAKDEHYTTIVETIAQVAHEERVLLVNRFDAMAELARVHPTTSYLAVDRFHLNDLGYRCMAEYAARAIVAGVIQADVEQMPKN